MTTEIFVLGQTKNPAIQRQAFAKWSIVCVLNNGAVEKRDGAVCLNNATTKRAVLTALRDALMRFSKAAVIRIYVTDDYVRNALIQGWPRRWRDNGWHKIRLNGDIRHLDLWQQISEQMSRHAISIAGAEELDHKILKEMELKNGR